MKRLNMGLMEDIENYIKSNQGKTGEEIAKAMSLVKTAGGGVKYKILGNSVSTSISQLIKTRRAHYKAGGKSSSGRDVFKVYSGPGGTLVGPNRGSHHKRKRTHLNGSAPTPAKKVITASGTKVDVQLLIAIGERDTLVGLDTARALYERLSVFFDGDSETA